MKYTPEQIQKKYESLPKDIKTAVSSIDTTNAILDIGEKYKLHVDKMGELIEETTFVMLGFEHSNMFIDTIKKRLKISQELAEKIVKDINEQIFVKIRESLKKIHEKPKEKNISFGEVKKNKSAVNGQNIIKPSLTIEDNFKKETSIINKEEILKKEDILKEIEEPLQAPEKKEFINKNLEKNEQDLVDDSLSVDVQKKPLVITEKLTPTPTTQTTKLDIVESKLTQTIKEPIVVEEKIVEEEKEKQIKEPAIDPYREPIE